MAAMRTNRRPDSLLLICDRQLGLFMKLLMFTEDQYVSTENLRIS